MAVETADADIVGDLSIAAGLLRAGRPGIPKPVAVVLAAWLDAVIEDAQASLALEAPDCPNCGEGCGGHAEVWLCDRCCGAVGDECGCTCGFDKALAVARAICDACPVAAPASPAQPGGEG